MAIDTKELIKLRTRAGGGSGGGVSPEEVTTIVKEQFPGGVGYEEFNPIVIAEEQTAVNDGMGGFVVNGTGLVDGENYIITFDGVEYTRTAHAGPMGVYIGELIIDGTDPFSFVCADGMGFVGMFSDGAEHTFKITTGVKQYKIDKKFLPAGVAAGAEMPTLRLKLQGFNITDIVEGTTTSFRWDMSVSYEQLVATAQYGGVVLYDADGCLAVSPLCIKDSPEDETYFLFNTIYTGVSAYWIELNINENRHELTVNNIFKYTIANINS